eukprot:TRINITY_DN53117_c0_g1_i1.p1 TRINITY_DN53117_c0_g1~~TRINITY_DN53117_c0_g1_i1.p1  ORF type:complete len:204 (+),score=22.46 TRINITY_DN53117_c0_g1_i1:68-679(+)
MSALKCPLLLKDIDRVPCESFARRKRILLAMIVVFALCLVIIPIQSGHAARIVKVLGATTWRTRARGLETPANHQNSITMMVGGLSFSSVRSAAHTKRSVMVEVITMDLQSFALGVLRMFFAWSFVFIVFVTVVKVLYLTGLARRLGCAGRRFPFMLAVVLAGAWVTLCLRYSVDASCESMTITWGGRIVFNFTLPSSISSLA